jgi:RHS repeat-associated protein
MQALVLQPLVLWHPSALADCNDAVAPPPEVPADGASGGEGTESDAPGTPTPSDADKLGGERPDDPNPDLPAPPTNRPDPLPSGGSGDAGDGGSGGGDAGCDWYDCGAGVSSGGWIAINPAGFDTNGASGEGTHIRLDIHWVQSEVPSRPSWYDHVLDPINVTLADKSHLQVDYISGGAAPLQWTRLYHSNLSAYAATVTTPMGVGWRNFYDRSVQVLSSTQVRLHRANGRAIDFSWTGSSWASALPSGTLTALSGGWSYLNERDTLESYDSAGHLTSLTFAGLVTTLQYDTAGRMARVANPFGRALTFGYDTVGRLNTVNLPSGAALTYAYDGQNNLASVRFADNSARQYRYENSSFPNALTGVVDESNRRRLTWSYDAQGRPAGGWYGNNVNAVSVQYGNGVITTTDARGTQRIRTLANVAGSPAIASVQVAATADSAAVSTSFAYDASGAPSGIVSRNGETFTRTNDPRGRAVSMTRAAGTASAVNTAVTWHGTWNRPVQVVTAGVTYTRTLDVYGRTLQVTRTGANGTAETVLTRTYNAQNLLASQTNARGQTVSYGYDSQGNRTTHTDAQGRQTLYSNFNAHGQAGKIVRPDGSIVYRSFDTRGRLVARTDTGRLTQFTYDGAGRFSSITWPDGSWHNFGYTEAGHLVTVNNHRSETALLTRDAAGKVTGTDIYNSAGVRMSGTRRTLDALGRLATATDSRNYAHRVLYDAATARPAGVQDPTGRTITFGLDVLDRTTSVTQPNTAAMAPVTGSTRSSSYAYSQDGRARHVSTSDTNGVATSFGHDPVNRPKQEAGPDAGTRNVVRNTAGEITSLTDARNITTNRTFDASGRLTAVTPSNNSAGFTYSYVPSRTDAALAQMTYPNGSTSWTYDAAGRVISKSQTVFNLTRTLTINRDSLGRPITLIYPSGMQVGISYSGDAISALTVNGQTLLNNISYRPFSQTPAGWRWGNGTPHTRAYDADGRTTSVTLGGSTRSYNYDAAGRVGAFTDTAPGINRASSFAYDEADHISGFAGPQGTSGYGWDTNHNRRTEITGGTSRSYNYATGSNRLTGFNGASTLTYGTDGNPLADSAQGVQYIYDGLQRLVDIYRPQTGVMPNGWDVQSTYDALGMRVWKGYSKFTYGDFDAIRSGDPLVASQAGSTRDAKGATSSSSASQDKRWAKDKRAGPRTPKVFGGTNLANKSAATQASGYFESVADIIFFHDDAGHLLGEYDLSNSRVQETIWFAGMPVATVQSNGALYYVHSDHLSTPRSVTRPGDNFEVWRWDSEPFGRSPAVTDSAAVASGFTFNLRFPGQYLDAETSLHYNWMRFYDPRIGRYLEADPIGLGGGMARYTYVGGNPVSFTDPLGLLYIAIRAELSDTFIVIHTQPNPNALFATVTFTGLFTIANAQCNFFCFFDDKVFEKLRDAGRSPLPVSMLIPPEAKSPNCPAGQ